jgi:hypothetical protein
MLHRRLLEAGVRLYALAVDSPERNSAMVEKLSLPFPYLSDPDRTRAITPWGVADPKDERLISRPAVVIVTPGGEEGFRFVSRDFADRMAEDQILAAAEALNLPPTTQDRPRIKDPQPGPRSLTPDQLRVYFRGARFAAQTMGLRHGHYAEEIKADSKAYVAEMDRFAEALKWLHSQRED